MKKTLFSGFRKIRCERSLAIILAVASTLPSLASAQEGEALDINGLRAQLETSRAQSNSPDTPLNNAKRNLDQEEEALMKKLQNVVPDTTNNAAVQPKPIESLEKIELTEEIVPAKKVEASKVIAVSEATKAVKAEVTVPEKQNVTVKKVEVASGENVKIPTSDKLSADLKKRVADLQARLNDKSKELEETRNRLVIAETQVERLSGILEKINNQKLAGYMGSGASAKPAADTTNRQAVAPLVNQVSNTKSGEESLVGIVTSQKAFLRSGPSKDDSPIMSVSKGTRLVVETRNDEWYRVITPTGGRAWISTQMLGFGAGAEAGSGSALRIGGYEKTLR